MKFISTRISHFERLELDRLGEFLKGCAGGDAMNVEELDGFFAALVASPEVAMPSEYLPEVFGGETDAHEFGSLEEANDILALLMWHWNASDDFAGAGRELPRPRLASGLLLFHLATQVKE